MKKNLDQKEKLAWLRLIRTENIGPITFYKLLNRFGSASKALEAIPELAKRGGRMEKVQACSIEDAEKEYINIEKYGAKLIARDEPAYPPLLAEIEDAPPVITVLGDVSILSQSSFSIVGARNASLAGRQLAASLAEEIGGANYKIVSGLARGIDTTVHKASLKTGTIAVVAGGIDAIYPRENEDLYKQIAASGAIVAESPFGVEPLARHFPKRNRIVSALSLGVLVVEAALKSGSLITARMSAEQNREVFAIPGSPMDPRAEGTNKLIQDGAHMVLNAQDILRELGSLRQRGLFDSGDNDWEGPSSDNVVPFYKEPDEKARENILEMLSPTPVDINDVIRESGGSAGDVLSILLELEIAGSLERQPGNKVNLI